MAFNNDKSPYYIVSYKWLKHDKNQNTKVIVCHRNSLLDEKFGVSANKPEKNKIEQRFILPYKSIFWFNC